MGDKPTVAILTDTLKGHGGEETVLKLFSDNLSDNFKIKLLIPLYQGPHEWIDGFDEDTIIKFNQNPSKVVKYTFLLKSLLLFQSDIVLCMTPKLTYFASKIKKIFHKKYKVVSWQHFSIFRPTDKSSFNNKKRWYGSADYYFAISSGISNELLTLGISPENIFTIFNPVIPSKKMISTNKSECAHFLCIARIQFEGQKNLKELFEASADLRGNWVIDIYGNDDTENNIEITKCKKYLLDNSLEKHVIWHGFVEDVWQEELQPDCLVLTSNFEGFPMSLCEAASHGIPLIAADCPTGPADIVNEDNGFLYKMHDIEALTKLMQKFIDHDVSFDSDNVKGSVSKYHVSNYIENVKSSINKIIYYDNFDN